MQTRITNVKLYEPLHPLHLQAVEILIVDEKIMTIAEEIKHEIIDVDLDGQGRFVSSGWIDLHVHAFVGVSPIGTNADIMGVDKGIPIIVDAGSAGSDNIDQFYELCQTAETKIFSLINISKVGLSTLHELVDLTNLDTQALARKVKAYPEFIRGIKVRESGSVVGENDIKPLVIAKEVAQTLDVPVMVHIGNAPPLLEDVAALLTAGDILTHCYHGKKNVNILTEDTKKVKDFVLEAHERGVIFDIGHGTDSFNYYIAKAAIAAGVKPDTISTDMYHQNIEQPVKTLALTMGKVMAAGLSIDEVLACVTKAPARALHLEDQYGTLSEGQEAVLTFFDLQQKPVECYDSQHNQLVLENEIVATGCFINNRYYAAKVGEE